MLTKIVGFIFEKSLKTLKIINLDEMYTNLGLLLSDECPFSIKCAIFEGKNDIIVIVLDLFNLFGQKL